MTAHRKTNSGLWPLLLALALSAAPPAIAAPRVDPVMTSALAHADSASRLFRSGDFAGALKEYEAARRLRASTAFDVGVARCFERLGRTEEAVVLYKQVLESLDSQPAHANEARERLRVLKTRVESEAAAPAATAKPTATAATAKPTATAATAKPTAPAATKPAAAAAPHGPEPRPATAATAKRTAPAATKPAAAAAPHEPAPRVATAPSEPAPEPAPLADAASEAEPEPEQPPEPAAGPLAWLLEPRRSLFIGIGVGAAAAVLVGTGLALYLSAESDYNGLYHNCAPRCDPAGVDGAGPAKEIVGGVLLGVGLVAAAADAALWVYRGLVRREPTAWILPAGAGLVAGGRF